MAKEYVKNFLLRVFNNGGDNEADFCILRLDEEDVKRYHKQFITYQQTDSALSKIVNQPNATHQLLTLSFQNTDPFFFYADAYDEDDENMTDEMREAIIDCDQQNVLEIGEELGRAFDKFYCDTKQPQSMTCQINFHNGYVCWEVLFHGAEDSCITVDLWAHQLFGIPEGQNTEAYMKAWKEDAK